MRVAKENWEKYLLYVLICLFFAGCGEHDRESRETTEAFSDTTAVSEVEYDSALYKVDSLQRIVSYYEERFKGLIELQKGRCTTVPLPDTANSVRVKVTLTANKVAIREFNLNKIDFANSKCFTTQSPYKMDTYLPLNKQDSVLSFYTTVNSIYNDNVPFELEIKVYDAQNVEIGKFPDKGQENVSKGKLKYLNPKIIANVIKLEKPSAVTPPFAKNN